MSSLCLFGTEVRLVKQIYALLPKEQICLFSALSSASISTRPGYLHKRHSASGLPSCSLCFLSLGRLGMVPQQTAFSYWPNHKLRMSHTETHRYCQGKKAEWDLDLLPDRKWEPSNPEKYINLEPLKANKHHLKYLSTFFKNRSQTKTRLISFSGSSFTCRRHRWMSPAGMWTRPRCWQSSLTCRLFAVSQSMFLRLIWSVLVGWMLHASGDTDGVLFEEAAGLLGRLESQVTAGGKLSRTNERERQPGRTDTFRAQEGLFQKDVNEMRCNGWVKTHPMPLKTSLIPVLCHKCQKAVFCIFYFLKFSETMCLDLDKKFPENRVLEISPLRTSQRALIPLWPSSKHLEASVLTAS